MTAVFRAQAAAAPALRAAWVAGRRHVLQAAGVWDKESGLTWLGRDAPERDSFGHSPVNPGRFGKG